MNGAGCGILVGMLRPALAAIAIASSACSTAEQDDTPPPFGGTDAVSTGDTGLGGDDDDDDDANSTGMTPGEDGPDPDDDDDDDDDDSDDSDDSNDSNDEGTTGSPPTAEPWVPAPGTTWHWQLTGDVDTSLDVDVYDIDLFDVEASLIGELQDAGRVVICYFSAGSYEEWRPDADQFPDMALGSELDGWPGERWLDHRDPTVREIMAARLDLAVEKGCDAVEPDNVDGYANNNGVGLTGDDQLDYNGWLATEAHARDLSIGLKNDLDQLAELADQFDWALNEECMQF